MDFLTGVSAASAADVWAAGRSGRHSVPVIEHWNGTSWAQVPQPASGFDSSLNSVAAISGTDAWAVGEQNLNQTVTEHWNGTAWTLVPSPSVTANNAQDVLGGVSAIGGSDVWAVGFSSVLGGPAAAVQRQHRLAPEPLPQRILPHQRGQFGQRLPMAAQREQHIDAVLDRGLPQLVQPGPLDVGPPAVDPGPPSSSSSSPRQARTGPRS